MVGDLPFSCSFGVTSAIVKLVEPMQKGPCGISFYNRRKAPLALKLRACRQVVTCRTKQPGVTAPVISCTSSCTPPTPPLPTPQRVIGGGQIPMRSQCLFATFCEKMGDLKKESFTTRGLIIFPQVARIDPPPPPCAPPPGAR